MARPSSLSALAFVLASTTACSSSPSDTSDPGAPVNGGGGSGEVLGTGGVPSTGGDAGAGATTASGGVPSTGGDAGAGATTGSGGGPVSSGEVLVHATFDARTVGQYTDDMIEGDFGNPTDWNNGLDEGRAMIVAETGATFLRVTYPAGEFGPNDGGVQFKVPLDAAYPELFLSYRVRFGAGFDWVKGGKLPGLVGGSAPTGCVDDTTGFSARMMWRTGGAAVQYLYFPDKLEACGDDYNYESAGNDVLFTPGVWHTVMHRIVMNTPGVANGVMQGWFDGQLVLDEQAFMWRTTGLSWEIDALYFSTFFGGGDSSWAPSTAQTIDYDDFVISTGPINQ